MMRIRRFIISGSLALSFFLVAFFIYNIGASMSPQPAKPAAAVSKTVKYRRDGCQTNGLKINARSVAVIDNDKGAWVYAKQPDDVRSVASLTKLLTAMVYLDSKADPNRIIQITPDDCYESSRSHIYQREAYRAIDLLHVALIASDNRAARALARASGLPLLQFIRGMNDKAISLGMTNTKMYEVTGLDERNVSTAADIAILVNEAMKYPLIRQATSKYKYTCRLQNKKRAKTFTNTNRLIKSKWEVLTGKTGYILESAYCLATILRDAAGRELTVVVLGSPSNGSRFTVARRLAEFGFKQAGRSQNGKRQVAG